MKLNTKNLVKFYSKRKVLQEVSIEINEGETVGLLGPNGAGKTTTFYIIMGIVKPNSGEVFLDEKNITNLPIYKRAKLGISCLMQEPSIFTGLSVKENLIAIGEYLNYSKKEMNIIVEEKLKELGLWHLRDQVSETLSGGEKRRCEIARILMTNPKFLLLDEPFIGIDPITVSELQNIILNLKKNGMGILITDHNVRDTLTITDRSYIIYEGKVLVCGDTQKLLNDPDARRVYLGEKFQV